MKTKIKENLFKRKGMTEIQIILVILIQAILKK